MIIKIMKEIIQIYQKIYQNRIIIKDMIMNNLIQIFINLKIKMILKKNLIFLKVNFQEKEHLELLNNVKVIMIKMNMQ